MLETYDLSINTNDKALLLNRLKNYSSNAGTEFISFYYKRLSDDLREKLRKELAESVNIKSKKTRNIIKENVKKVISIASEADPEQAAAIFVCQEISFYVKVAPQIAINNYYCDKQFYTEPLQNYNDLLWGLIVLSTQQYAIGLLENSKIKLLKTQETFVPGKIKAGGQSAQRYEESRRKQIEFLIDSISEKTNNLFQNKPIKKILLGGLVPVVDYFYNKNSLNPHLAALLEAPTSCAYTNQKGLEELLEKNKEQYEQTLKDYFRDNDNYDILVAERYKDNRKVFKIEQLTNIKFIPEGLFILEDLTLDAVYYNNLTKEISLNRTPNSINLLTSELPRYLFNSTTEKGEIFKNLFKNGIAVKGTMIYD